MNQLEKVLHNLEGLEIYNRETRIQVYEATLTALSEYQVNRLVLIEIDDIMMRLTYLHSTLVRTNTKFGEDVLREFALGQLIRYIILERDTRYGNGLIALVDDVQAMNSKQQLSWYQSYSLVKLAFATELARYYAEDHDELITDIITGTVPTLNDISDVIEEFNDYDADELGVMFANITEEQYKEVTK